MAYYTKEQRHEKELNHDGSFSLENKLQAYLRDKYSPESLESSYACEAAEKLLANVARDYDAASGKQEDMNKPYEQIARQAIVKYLNNWKNKTPGEDDRGKRFGKSQDHYNSFDTIKNTITGLQI